MSILTTAAWLAQLGERRAPVCWAGGHGFEPRPDQHSGSRLTALTLIWFLVGRKRTHPRVGDVDLGVVVNLHTSHHSHHGLGGYSKLTNELRAMLRQMLMSELTVHILLTSELTVHMLKCIVGGHVCCSLIHSSRPRPYLKTTNRTERHLQICLP